MYISDIAIKNYLVHKDTSISLLPLTVFVGPNGGGKSAFFDALLNFSMLARGTLRQAFGPYPFSYRATLHRGVSAVSRIGYRLTMKREQDGDRSLHYEIDYSQAGGAEAPRTSRSSENDLFASRMMQFYSTGPIPRRPSSARVLSLTMSEVSSLL